jgi:cytosine/uracil/thiamine/allantoin permease
LEGWGAIKDMSYKQQWQEYKKRSRIYWLAVIAFVIGLAVGLPLAVTKFPPGLFYVYLFTIVGAGLAVNIYGYYRSFWKCPHCNEPFFRSPKWRGTMMYPIFTRHCMNCDLPKWAENK